MATREEVENAIAAIEDNGNNTAKEVREVLTTLLDFTGSSPSGNTLEAFKFDDSIPIKATESKGALLYSFKGFKNFHVNFSFILKASKNNDGVYEFALPQEIGEILGEIMNKNNFDFIVPVRQQAREEIFTTAAPMNIEFQDQKLLIRLTNVQNQKGTVVKTSIQFHMPKFFEGQD